jgi:hypothetical protein
MHSAVNMTIWLYMPHMLKVTAQEVEYFAYFHDQMSRWLMHPSGKCWQIEWVMLCSHPKMPQVFIVGDWKHCSNILLN